MRIVGLDIHRAFAEAAAWENGRFRRLGRIDMRRDPLTAFAERLSREDVVVVEATGNASAVAAVIAPHVKRVVIASPRQVRMIAHAKIKTDAIDAGVLARLYAGGFLPAVWTPDEPTQALRRQVTRRNQIVRQRSRLKNIIQSILHAHLIPSCPHADLCGGKGRAWLSGQIAPEDERLAIERHLREFNRLGEDLTVIKRDLARSALADEGVKRLMTIPGVDMVVGLAIMAAIGEVGRFSEPQKLVSHLGLNPSVRQSGPGPAHHGRITRQGRGHARGMLVEAAWAAARAPGPLRAFFASEPGAAGMWRRSRPRASSPSRSGICSSRARATSGRVRCSTPKSSAIPNSGLGTRRHAGRRAPRTPATSKAAGTRSGAGSSRPRRPMRASSPAGTHAGRNGCARAPQPRRDHKGGAAGLPPQTLLFATRPPVRQEKTAKIRNKGPCRSHQWSRGGSPWSTDARCRSRRKRGRRCAGRHGCPACGA